MNAEGCQSTHWSASQEEMPLRCTLVRVAAPSPSSVSVGGLGLNFE